MNNKATKSSGPEYEEVLSRILKLKEASSLSQKGLSTATGLSESIISRTLTRTSVTSIENLLKLERTLSESAPRPSPYDIATAAIAPKSNAAPAVSQPEQASRDFTFLISVTTRTDLYTSKLVQGRLDDAEIETLAQAIREPYNAESCSIVTFYPIPSGEGVKAKMISFSTVRAAPRGDWIESLSTKVTEFPHPKIREAYDFFCAQASGSENKPFVDRAEPDKPIKHGFFLYLSNSALYSFIAAPLRDRRNRLIGLVCCENRYIDTPDGRQFSLFTPREVEALTTIVANRAALCIEAARRKRLKREILKIVNSADTFSDDTAQKFLPSVVEIMNADAAELALYDPLIGDLRSWKHTAFSERETEGQESVSDIRSLWNKRPAPHFLTDSTVDHSGLAVRLPKSARRMGILYVRSRRPNVFDSTDVELLTSLAQYISIAIDSFWEESLLSSLTKIDLKRATTGSDIKPILEEFLQTARKRYSLSGALIYLPDASVRSLHCRVAVCGNLKKPAEEFFYELTETSLANWVFKTNKAQFIEDVFRKTDLPLNRKGVDYFEMAGALAVLPLSLSNRCIGVLVCWSQDSLFTEGHLERLKPIAALSAWTIATFNEGNAAFFHAIQSMPIGIFRKDREGKFTYVNGYFAKTAGFDSPDQLVGLTDFDIEMFRKSELAEKYHADDLALINGNVGIIDKVEDHMTLTADGEKPEKVCVKKMCIYDAAGNVIGIQGIFIPVTA